MTNTNTKTVETIEGQQMVERYKTRICKAFTKTGECPYDFKCMFAHGKADVRTKKMNIRDGLTSDVAVRAHQWRIKSASDPKVIEPTKAAILASTFGGAASPKRTAATSVPPAYSPPPPPYAAEGPCACEECVAYQQACTCAECAAGTACTDSAFVDLMAGSPSCSSIADLSGSTTPRPSVATSSMSPSPIRVRVNNPYAAVVIAPSPAPYAAEGPCNCDECLQAYRACTCPECAPTAAPSCKLDCCAADTSCSASAYGGLMAEAGSSRESISSPSRCTTPPPTLVLC